MSISILRRLLLLAHRELLQRRLPHGLISWRYLLPGQDALIRLHRQFWWQAPSRLPRSLWLLTELWLYLRWISWYAWRTSWDIASAKSSEVSTNCGMSRGQLFWRLLKPSLAHCMPPVALYHYAIYIPGHNPWEYIYAHECAAFHRWRDGCKQPDAIKTLADKQYCSQKFAELGLPHAQTARALSAGSIEPDWSTFNLPVFLKPRYGSAGRHCFYLRRDKDRQLQWQEYDKPPHSSELAYSAWRAAAKTADYLIQPCYENALAIRGICKELITLRVLTISRSEGWCVDLAYLEIPDGVKNYLIQPLDLQSGQLILLPQIKPNPAKEHWQPAQLHLLPHWRQAAASAIRAHGALAPDLYSVAWDFILNEGGALLLEGNSSWGLEALQTVRGPLLAKPDIPDNHS